MWPCNPAIEEAHAWTAGAGPIPDGEPPRDFVLTALGLHRLARGADTAGTSQ